MLTVKPVYKLLNVSDGPEMDYKHTRDTIYSHFWGITENIYGFGRTFIFCLFIFYSSTHISTRPEGILPVQMMGGRVSS